MKIKHLQFDTLDSTHIYLKEKVSDFNESEILISTKSQPSGIGRSSNSWVHFKDSLAFSFLVKPMKNLTLTPLEMGVQVLNFFQAYDQSLKLKWPNDLVTYHDGRVKKVGGILCQYIDKETILVSVGLNLSVGTQEKGFKLLPGKVDYPYLDHENFSHTIPSLIYQYILKNRLSKDSVISCWRDYCFHHKKKVLIKDDLNETEGLFIGIGAGGQALIKTKEGTEEVISGSLFLVD